MTVAVEAGVRQVGSVLSLSSGRLDTLCQGLSLREQGLSVSAAAQDLNVPRSTLRDSLASFEMIDLPAAVKKALVTHEGQGFLKRMCVSLHLCFRAGGDAGLRSISAFLEMTGLNGLIGASVGAQWLFGQKVEAAIAQFGEEEVLRMAPATSGKKITIAADENFHEGPCLVALEPQSGFLLCETAAPNRELSAWRDSLAPMLALLGVQVTQVVSDSGKSLVALCESHFGGHHAPDLFHILYDFKKTFTRTTRRERRILEREMCILEKEVDALKSMMSLWAELAPARRGRGAPPQFERRINEEETKHAALLRRWGDLDAHQQKVDEALKVLSDGYHPVSLVNGRRTGANTIRHHLEQVALRARNFIAEFSLGEEAESAVEKLERMGEKMAETLARNSALWHSTAVTLATNAQEAYVIESLLAPAAYLHRVGERKGTLTRHELTTTARKLREQAIAAIGRDRVELFLESARGMAHEFHRSSSPVEGRNGVLSLRHHAFHELTDQKRAVLTTLHNHVIRRADGSTAAERLSGVPSRDITAYLCSRIESFPRAGGPHRLRKAA